MDASFNVNPGLEPSPQLANAAPTQLTPEQRSMILGTLAPGPVVSPPPAPAPAAGPAPAPAPAPTPPAPVTVAVPQAPGANPFDQLPFPAPGDRIKADDFKALSQALKVIADMAALTASLFGHSFGEVKLAVTTQGYQIARVMSVFGAEIARLDDASLDGRKVIQVLPIQLGSRGVIVVVTEAVDTRKFAPNLIGLTYPEAQERLRAIVGEVPTTGSPPNAPSLMGLTLAQTQQALPG
jgi:hypothetical protein